MTTTAKAAPRKSSPRKLSVAQQRRLVEKFLEEKDGGKEAYARADKLLEQIIAGVAVGTLIELAGGRTAELVDNFAEKNKVFKPCGVSRFDVKVSHAK